MGEAQVQTIEIWTASKLNLFVELSVTPSEAPFPNGTGNAVGDKLSKRSKRSSWFMEGGFFLDLTLLPQRN